MHYWRESKMGQPLWILVNQLLQKLNTNLLDDPAIPLLGVTQEKWNVCPQEDSWMNVDSSVIHDRPKVETQMPITGEGINKIWCICTVEHYSVARENVALILPKTRLNPQKRHAQLKKPDPKDLLLLFGFGRQWGAEWVWGPSSFL